MEKKERRAARQLQGNTTNNQSDSLCMVCDRDFPQNQMAMAASAAEVAVFTETNIGTRLALSVPPNITAADFKRRLEREHFGCFPEAGAIRAHGLMVNRRSCFYHLPDSMPIKYAFLGSRGGAWFLHADLGPSSVVECVAAAKDHEDGTNSNNMVETSSATSSSDVVSVEGLIKKYFTSFNEASNSSSRTKSGAVQSRTRGKQKRSGGGGGKRYRCRKPRAADFTVKTLPRLLNAVSSPPNKSKVGKRLVMASYSLGISPGWETVSSLRRSRTGKSLRSSSSPIRCPVFEISGDSDD